MACLLIEPWDFSEPLFGNGCIAVADSAIRNLGSKLKLVGSSSKHPAGRWTRIEIGGWKLDFLPVAHPDELKAPRWFASNAEFAASVRKHLGAILDSGLQSALTQTYTILWLLAFSRRDWDICFYCPGLANPLLIGKRPRLGRLLANFYEQIQAKAINRASVVFAAASPDVIAAYNQRLARRGIRRQIQFLPTAVNLDLFRPRSREAMRLEMGLPQHVPIFTFVGRLAAVKGIPFLFQALQQVHATHPDALLLLAGDGEQREELKGLAATLGLEQTVRFLGACAPLHVAKVIASANVCVCGSLAEGFSNAMVEQIACGRPIVSTSVSGADRLIQNGRNGFIVGSREPALFSQRMIDALNLPEAEHLSRQLAETHYSDRSQWEQAAAAWPALR